MDESPRKIGVSEACEGDSDEKDGLSRLSCLDPVVDIRDPGIGFQIRDLVVVRVNVDVPSGLEVKWDIKRIVISHLICELVCNC